MQLAYPITSVDANNLKYGIGDDDLPARGEEARDLVLKRHPMMARAGLVRNHTSGDAPPNSRLARLR